MLSKGLLSTDTPFGLDGFWSRFFLLFVVTSSSITNVKNWLIRFRISILRKVFLQWYNRGKSYWSIFDEQTGNPTVWFLTHLVFETTQITRPEFRWISVLLLHAFKSLSWGLHSVLLKRKFCGIKIYFIHIIISWRDVFSLLAWKAKWHWKHWRCQIVHC